MPRARRSIACSHCVPPRRCRCRAPPLDQSGRHAWRADHCQRRHRLLGPDGQIQDREGFLCLRNRAPHLRRGARSIRCAIAQGRDLRGGTGKSAAESGTTITAPQSKLRARRKFANRPNGRLRSCHHFATPRDLCRRDRILALRRSRGSSEGVSGKDRAPLSSDGDHRGARRMVSRAARAVIDSAPAS
jgi:hypothetical protein